MTHSRQGLRLSQGFVGWMFVMGLSGTAIAEAPPSVSSSAPPSEPVGLESSEVSPAYSQGALHPCPGIYYEPPHNELHLVPVYCPPNLATQRQIHQAHQASFPPVAGLDSLEQAGAEFTLPALQPSDFLPSREVVSNSRFDGIGGEVGSLPPQLLAARGLAPEDSLNPPLPGAQQDAIAIVRPEQGLVSIVLTNNTVTEVTYEVLGHFSPRTLAAAESIVLRDVPTPTTLTLVRPDGGFLNVTPLDLTETQQTYEEPNSAGLLSLVLNASGQFDTVQGALTIEQDGRVFIQ